MSQESAIHSSILSPFCCLPASLERTPLTPASPPQLIRHKAGSPLSGVPQLQFTHNQLDAAFYSFRYSSFIRKQRHLPVIFSFNYIYCFCPAFLLAAVYLPKVEYCLLNNAIITHPSTLDYAVISMLFAIFNSCG